MLSIIVPVYNEEESLEVFYKELILNLRNRKNYEIIFIDDGSTDKSLEILKQMTRDQKVKILSFRKNQGKAEALTLGFQKAKGDLIVTLDADLQDKPDQIDNLLKMNKNGYDLVCGWRKNRKDSLPKIVSSRIFNILAKKAWGMQLHDYNCGLKSYTKEAAKNLNLYGGLHRFIPLLTYQQGFKVCEVPVQHQERLYGKSKYGFSKIWKDLPDIFTMLFLSRYENRPLHFFGVVGFVSLFLGVGILIYLTIGKLFGQGIGDRPILFLGMLLIISGFQIFLTGFLADLFINISNRKNKGSSLRYSNIE
ncbi:MAG: glycosyltransferase family 2 protein [Actinobacteria bacterium]|nr:glycosyltransferase family 2 protein [Actinomycetota bacterium]